MADVLVRLDVQSEAYESKLKNATANLQHMEKEVRRVGATFEVADKEDLEFIKSLGSMETHATNASGKIKEMTQSIAEMTMVYNRMSDAEKNAATGQALAASIAQQKSNLAEFKDALADASGEAQKTGGFIDTLADGLGQLGPAGQMAAKLLKGAFGPVGIAIAAVVGVIHQVVEAFKRNEDAMAGAARAAAPFKAIWQQIQRIFDKIVPHIASGMEKIADIFQSIVNKITGWIGDLGQTWLGKKLGLDEAYESLKKFREENNKLVEDNKKIADSENALNKLSRSTEKGNAVRRSQISELRAKASNKTDYSAEERVGFLEQAQKLEGQTLQANLALRQKELDLIKLKNSLTETGREDRDAENAAEIALIDARTEYNDHIRATQRALETARKEMEKEAAVAPTEPAQLSGPTGPSMSRFEELQQSIRIKLADDASAIDTTSLNNLLSVAIQNGIDSLNPNFEELMYKMGEGFDIPDEAWENLTAEINEKLADLGLDPIELDVTTGGVQQAEQAAKGTADAWQNAVAAVNNVGSALQQIEDPAAKVSGIVMQAVANIALGFAQAAASPATGAAGVFGWIAAATAGVATMVSTIAAIKSATSGGFANGGIVPGNSFSGDNLRTSDYGINSGELILNRAQQGSIASQLQGAAQQTIVVTGKLSGRDIRLSANNDNRSRGGDRNFYSKIH